MSEPFYITTAIAYANGTPHIGHAYELVASDAIARFHRLDGKDVFFLTGTDEHGQKMEQTAQASAVTPIELADLNSQHFQSLLSRLNISNDDFIRTTETRHKRTASEFWRRMVESGDIYKSTYEGWYSLRDEAYYPEEETVLGVDGVRYSPQGSPVKWVEEDSYFFALSKYQDRLLKYFEENPEFVGPKERFNEVKSFVKSGLKDFSVSRTNFTWGIPVPNDPSHIMYVWVDALANYVSALDVFGTDEILSRFWPASLHVIGKDIIRFHAVYWPALLMSAGLPVPRKVFAHGFILNNGQKMSKSIGNVIDPVSLLERFGADYVRYFLLREIPFGQDGNCDENLVSTRVNADLANGVGNLASRSLSMISRNSNKMVPTPSMLSSADEEILSQADRLYTEVKVEFEKLQIHRAVSYVMSLVNQTDKYFAGQAPWALKDSDPNRMKTVLYVTAEVLRQIAIVLQPFTPEAAADLLNLLAVPSDRRSFLHLGPNNRLSPGLELPVPSPLFPRV